MKTGSIAVVGGRIIPRPGEVLDAGTVVIRDGVVDSVDADSRDVSDLPVIEAAGRWVTAGLVDGHAHVGLNEGSQGSPGVDTNESSRPSAAGVRALDAIDIHGLGFRDAVAGGVTTTVIKPGSSNVFGGTAVAIKTWGGASVDDQVLREEVSIKSAFGENPKSSLGGPHPLTRMGVAGMMRQELQNARHYAAERAQSERDGTPFRVDLDLAQLARLLDGELLWDVHAHRHDDIATALRLAEEFGLRLVINHATEGDRVAELIAERGFPVIFGPAITPAIKVELAGYSTANIVALAHAGVTIALMSDHPETPIGLLAVQAVLAAREGLDPDLAWGAITSTAASIYGLDDRVGSLASGLDGDLVVWSGHPLDASSKPEYVVINGRVAFDGEPR